MYKKESEALVDFKKNKPERIPLVIIALSVSLICI